jgi:hypothetical protein
MLCKKLFWNEMNTRKSIKLEIYFTILSENYNGIFLRINEL